MSEPDLVVKIITVVAKEAGLNHGEALLRRNRERYYSKFRDDAIYLARERTSLSLPQLGFLFRRHHTSVLASYNRVKLRRDRNPPRKDKRTWVEWHNYLWQKVSEACESSAPVV